MSAGGRENRGVALNARTVRGRASVWSDGVHRAAACIDTGATFSLLAENVYEEIQDDLPALRPRQVYLRGWRRVATSSRGGPGRQLLHVGRLEGLDLLLGMDWLTTYGVAINCAAQTIRMRSDSIQFG
jgi:hypothetical protein